MTSNLTTFYSECMHVHTHMQVVIQTMHSNNTLKHTQKIATHMKYIYAVIEHKQTDQGSLTINL